jgi:hypothetical protein
MNIQTEEKQIIWSFCKRCGTLFDIKFLGKKNEQKFCSSNCQIKYNKEETKKAKEYYKSR